MHAQVIQKFGDPSVFESMELPKPTLKPGHVLIRVKATSVNPVDCKIRSGSYSGLAMPFPTVLQGDVAGVVEAVSPDVTTFKVGDEVYGCAGGVIGGEGGALADYMLADAALLALKPRSISMQETAALPLVAITAWEALFDKLKIKSGQTILIHAGTGGVGHVAIQLAKAAGARVCATISSDDKAKIALSLGADEVINYHDESTADYVSRLTAGKGFDLIFDTVGSENLTHSFAALALNGSVVTIQANATLHLGPLHSKSGSLHTVLMLIPLIYHQQREEHGRILTKIAELVDKGKLKPLIDPHVFSLNQVADAHALLESGKAVGKIVINCE